MLPWGKWHGGEEKLSLSLADHCLDVAIVLQSLVRIPSFWRSLGQPLNASQIARLGVVAFLHDFGKCNWGFQAKTDPSTKESAGHVLEAIALLFGWQDLWPDGWRRLIENMCSWFCSEEQAGQMLLASISHHGRPVSTSDIERFFASSESSKTKRFWQVHSSYDPRMALNELAQAARAAFPQAFATDATAIDATPALQQRFAGLVMLADWIGSDTQFFPYSHDSGQTRADFSSQAAQRALRAIGLVPPEPRQPKPFAEVFPFQPTPLQAALAHDVEANEGARLLLIESDTGSGKTEAALAWFFRLYAEGKVDGLYFALPTRVAARELYQRVLKAVDAAFEPALRPGPVLLAAPGYVSVDGVQVSLLTDPQGTLWDDNAHDLKRERLWSAERPKRFLAAPIAVGTIDQALLSALQVKHSLLRSVCLDRHLLVVDEVHASDPYMREVLKTLLAGHLGRGGWALLLSATLGETSAAAFFGREVLPLSEAQKKHYPLLSAPQRTWPMPVVRSRSVTVELSPLLTDDAALAPQLITALRAGARVLVVCNTVARANALFRQVEALMASECPELLNALFQVGGICCPHHGRFAREDREVLDAAVSAQLGKGSPDGARLVIGTQTLEQSLDIDADWLVTDLAPMDVLIQRLGRLHRHERTNRPQGFDTARALVRVPEKDLATYLNKDQLLRAPAGLGSVYVDGRVLALTWQMLAQQGEVRLPDQARELIEGTTHPEAFARLPEPWGAHGHEIEGKELGEVRQALCSVLDVLPFGELHYPDKSERVLTRLGNPTYDLPLAAPMCSPFGQRIHRVPIPAHWLQGETVPESVAAQGHAEGFSVTVGARRFRYTRFGLEKDDA